MSKERISATVDPEVAEYLQKEGVNASGAINKAIKQQMGVSGENTDLIELRLEQVEGEIDRHESSLESLYAQKEALEERLEEIEENRNERRQDKLRKLKQVPDDPSHPLVQEVAEELDMTPEEAIEKSKEL